MKMILLIVLSCLAGLTLVQSAMAEENGATPGKTFLVIYTPGPAWLQGRSVTEQPLREHGNYLLGLYRDGVMIYAGPLDDDGGAVVLNAADMSEAEAIVAADPGVQSGILVPAVHHWQLRPWDEFLERATGERRRGSGISLSCAQGTRQL
jgi:uncharacterized protein YciI